MTGLLLGKDLRDKYDPLLKRSAESLAKYGTPPVLATLRVGRRPDDVAYEQSVVRSAQKVGIAVRSVVLPENVTQEAAIQEIHTLNADHTVHGILMFRPLPAHIDDDLVRNEVDPAKDIDGITDVSGAALYSLHRMKPEETSLSNGFMPCTAEAVMRILNHYGIPVSGRKAVVLGRSGVIGKPVSLLLLARDATVTICHRRTEHLEEILCGADIIVAAAGVTGWDDRLGAPCFSEGQIVIDVGIHTDAAGNLYGDVDTDEAAKIVDRITPVPGGVGGVTTLCLLEHVVRAAEAAAETESQAAELIFGGTVF
ncbi:MAG: bifunctional 5,10-methylenetetrahydrofolate dehydrogenase/5,10-methenyltetrahydrofolate cyclohydrolase [Clostridiales Family XIII bacterium]|jgi:methylenetetrahydrofolate dehydrogenase (NADP+)/methenyltetrahydrofolate cyclohydrolase|nr:bifunctional 5,10-methylenetetrahydrofolate dehydrogenase/5,10-methenyltetrahydrofolate cyclohydrolase [Clostridiales Family XIII bacterium]